MKDFRITMKFCIISLLRGQFSKSCKTGKISGRSVQGWQSCVHFAPTSTRRVSTWWRLLELLLILSVECILASVSINRRNGDVSKTGHKSFLHCCFLLENLSWACHFASVCAAMSLLKFFHVQGKDPNWESIKTSDYMTCIYVVDLQNNT